MFVILILTSIVVFTTALEPAKNIELGDEKVRATFSKYIAKIPDIEDQYVVDERLSRAISHYFKGKLSAFPLFKVSIKIDRNPVKIPWTMGTPNLKKEMEPRSQMKRKRPVKKRYKYNKALNSTGLSKKLVANNIVSKSKPIENRDYEKVFVEVKDSEKLTNENNDSEKQVQKKRSEKLVKDTDSKQAPGKIDSKVVKIITITTTAPTNDNMVATTIISPASEA